MVVFVWNPSTRTEERGAMERNLAVDFLGLKLEHPIMNGGGTCKDLEGVKRLARSAVAAIEVGSITEEKRDGNPGQVFWLGSNYSVNSLGMPNMGRKKLAEVLPEMVRTAHDAGKPLFVNVAGFSDDEYLALTETSFAGGADGVFLNGGCPNAWGVDGMQKKILSFSLLSIEKLFQKLSAFAGKRILLKISPQSDPAMRTAVIDLVREDMSGKPNTVLAGIITTNTFPNAFVSDADGKPAIYYGEGFAGLSGPALKPIAMAHVKEARKLLPPGKVIVAAGGVSTGQDVLDYLRAGAGVVQLATAYFERERPGGSRAEAIFGDLLQELLIAMGE